MKKLPVLVDMNGTGSFFQKLWFSNECWGVLKKAYFQHSFCCNKIHL